MNPSDDELQELSDLVAAMISLEDDIAATEEKLKEAKAVYEDLRSATLPEKMQELGFAELKSSDGHAISIKPFYYGSVNNDNRELCLAWLGKHGHLDIVKHDVTCSFTKGEDMEANRLMLMLKTNGVHFLDRETVHPQTLKAFIKEQVETGIDFPFEMFKAGVVQRATIKRKG